MAKTLEKKSLKREKKQKEKRAGESSHERKDEGNTTEDNVDQKQEDSFLSGDFVEDEICEKETSNCKESASLPCFKLAKPNSLEEFLNEKEKTIITLPDSDNIASSDLHVRDFKKNENFPATDDIIVLEDKANDKFESFKERYLRQQQKCNASGLRNVSKSETKIGHRMTLNFAEMPAGNSSGMKFSDLKEHLISAMQKKKEVAFKKFKESDNIDNEIASDEELYEGSSTGRCDSLREDIEDICSTTSSSEFEENMNKLTSQEENIFKTAESETKHEIIITAEENKYEEASAASSKVEIGSVKGFLDSGIMDVQFTEIEEEVVTAHFDDVQTCQPRYCIEGKTYSTATAVENLGKELNCAMENEKELAMQKNSETDSIDNESDSDVVYCGYICASNSAKNYKAIPNSAEKIVNNFKDSEVKGTNNGEEPKIIFEKFWKSESGASSSRSNTEDYINVTKKTFDDSHSNGKHNEANNAQNNIVLKTASDSVESTYNFDLEYLTSSAIPSYQPCAASSKHSCSVQPLDENSVEEVIQSSTNDMTENTQDYNAASTGRCILNERERKKFPFSFSHYYMQTPLRSHFLESGLYISNIGNACVKPPANESSSMCDVHPCDPFASQEVNDFCSGPFITPFEEKNVKEVHSATVKDSAATSIDDDSDVVLLDRSESEEEKAASSSSSCNVDLPLHFTVSIYGSPNAIENPNNSSTPPYTRDPIVYPSEYEVEERKFSGKSEEDKSINSGLECGEECEGETVESEEEEERKISSDETEEEQEDEISFDEIGNYKPASCASPSEDEYNADEGRKIVFEKSIRDYIDDEAVLSGDDDDEEEEDDDEGEDMEVDSDAEKECADGEAIENSEMLRKQIAPMHMKQVLADDDRAVKFLQNKFLNEGDLHSTGARNRKFVWKNDASILNENLCEESEDDDDDTELQEAREMMREKFLHEERTESNNEDNFIIGSNKSMNLCVLENTASPSEVRPASKRPRSSMLSNEEDAQTKLKRRKMKDEATSSGTRAVKNCVFRSNDTETGNKMLAGKTQSEKFDPKSGNQNLDAGDSNDSNESDTCVFNDLQ